MRVYVVRKHADDRGVNDAGICLFVSEADMIDCVTIDTKQTQLHSVFDNADVAIVDVPERAFRYHFEGVAPITPPKVKLAVNTSSVARRAARTETTETTVARRKRVRK